MPKYFFNLVDGTHSTTDRDGKELDSLHEAHLYALRMCEKLVQYFPDNLSLNCRIEITTASGEPILTVLLPALAAQKKLQRKAG